MLRKYYPKMLILIKDVCMKTEGWGKKKKKVLRPKQEHSLVVFEMLFFYGRINCISQIITLLALVKTIQKHAKLFESTQYTVLPETSKGSHWQFAAQPSEATVCSACKLAFPKASQMQCLPTQGDKNPIWQEMRIRSCSGWYSTEEQ